MLGSQARAAELQAVRSAAMRQKTHEIEEQIPAAAAVSLTDFARGQPVSKNKGPKQYKPLSLDDLENHLDDDLVAATTHSSNTLETETSRSISAEPSFHTPSFRRFVPSASRSMWEASSMPSSTRVPSRTFRTYQQNSENTLNLFSPLLTPVNGKKGHQAASQTESHLPPARSLASSNFIFGLNEYSPAKPELQFERFRSLRGPNNNHPSLTSITTENEYLPIFQGHPYHNFSVPFHRADMAQHPSNLRQFGAEPYGHENSYFQPRFERSNTFATDIMLHENKLHEVKRDTAHSGDTPYNRTTKMQSFVAAQQAMAKTGKTVLHNPQLATTAPEASDLAVPESGFMHPRTLNDPNRTICSKASETNRTTTLTESATRGPTDVVQAVPSNPSIKSAFQQDPFSSGFTPQPRVADLVKYMATSEGGFASNPIVESRLRLPQECPAIWRALQKRDRLQLSDHVPLVSERCSDPDLDNEALVIEARYGEMFSFADEEIGSSGWCALREMTGKDRERMRAILLTFSEGITHLNHEFELKKQYSSTVDTGHAWMQPPTMDGAGLDGNVARLIDEHNAKRSLPTMTTKKGGANMVQVVDEHNLATITDDLEVRKASADSAQSFAVHDSKHRSTKFFDQDVDGAVSVSHGTLRARMLDIDGQATSSPPARLARDPRYRPLSTQMTGLHGCLHLW